MRYFFGFLMLLCSIIGFSQLESKYTFQDADTPDWVQLMYADDADPGAVINAYEKYYRNNEFVKNSHTQYYKRWLRSIARELDVRPETDKAYLKKSKELRMQRSSAQWESIGPYDWDHEAAGLSYAPGNAHVYTVEMAPSNNDVMYAGTATCGLWKSTDHGVTWNSLTDDLLFNGLTAIEISPTNPDVLYTEMFGSVYKSIDGGVSFNPTGDAAFQAISMNVKDIVALPGSTNTVFLCSDEGLYRTTNGGTSWVQEIIGDFLELEFHPTNNAIVYATNVSGDTTQFWRSTDGGLNWTQQTSGWPVPPSGAEQKRTEIAVSPDMPNRVVALCTGAANGGSGLYGVYVSDDQGQTWTFQCCGPQPSGPASATNMNLMGWSDEGLDDGGQYYYDLALDISPTNGDSIFVAGVNLWVSADGGQSFTCPAKWSHSTKPNYVHADIHDVHYYDSQNLWVSGDGGIFHSTDGGANFTRRNVGIAGTDFWGFGMGHWYGDVMLGGAYHNGTLLKEEDTYKNGWLCTDGGDGTLGFVNYGLDRQVYSWFNIKELQSDRTIAPVTRGFDFKPNNTYITGRSSDLIVHPQYYTTWYSGAGTQLVKTEDNGYSYDVVYDFGVDVAAMDISWSDPNTMYVTTFPDWWDTKTIFRTTDGGENWTEITPPSSLLNGDTWIPYDIVVSEQDPQKLWIVRTSMYSSSNLDGRMVFESTDGGDSWVNITGSSLDGETATCIQLQKGTDDGLYIGTRRTVYYKSDSESDWQLYNTGLPVSTSSTRIEMYYRKGLVRTGTNRSVWEIDFYEPSTPVAYPSVNENKTACAGDTFYFVDHSIVNESGVNWNWSFPGGNPSTSTERAPKVVYDEAGVFDVSLTVSDINGTDTKMVESMIQVNQSCGVDTIPGNCLFANGSTGHAIVEDFDLPNEESITITAWIKLNSNQPNYSAVFMNDGDAAGLNFREGNNTLAYHWPGGSWSWDSNLEVPIDEWTHVALVADETSVTLYMNGVGVTHNTNISPVDFTNIRLGSYKGWGSRNMDGQIDEVAIYDRALSQDEIRNLRHLTKYPETDPSLIAYYQFNNEFQLLDAVGNRNGTLNGTAMYQVSSAPVGGGVSERIIITNGGMQDFTVPGLSLGFPATGTNPDGEVVVSHLNVPPDVFPNGNPAFDEGYWVVNNYGANQTTSILDSVIYYNSATVTASMLFSGDYSFYRREANDHGGVWRLHKFNTTIPEEGARGKLRGIDALQLNSLGQFIVMREEFPQGTPQVTIAHDITTTNDPIAGASMELFFDTNNQGILLPVYSDIDLATAFTPDEGHFCYNSDQEALLYYDGTQWQKVKATSLLIEQNSSAPVATNNISSSPYVASKTAILALPSEGQYVQVSKFTTEDLINIAFPDQGMMVYDLTTKSLKYFNDHYWTSLDSEATTLPVSMQSNTTEQGISLGSNVKHGSSALQINSSNRAMKLPSNSASSIMDPQEGLLIFDRNMEKLMIYDGEVWRALKSI